jgi:RNA polymerase sigma-54 factor
MKQSLQLRVSQHLALTPQLQQSIRLLQLSTLELHQELEQIMADNPLLERMDDPLDHSVRLLADGAIASNAESEGPGSDIAAAPVAESPSGGDEPVSSLEGGEMQDAAPAADNDWSFDDVARTSKAPDEDDARPQLEAPDTTLRQHLMEQMRVTVTEQRDRALLELLIEALDENGYLEEPLEEIHARLPEELEIDPDELTIALKMLQSFDPAGIVARTLSECLAL